ncbi:hypothetical protein GCM10027176_36410 [Actinoallomurus bryophytorum]|uniref:Uncharacterized protein n=1 Tax=Actinoallomurus bryophytorum TaxID=1490222 RepID=A0A543CIN9_9ACTN|nr:hypothetical protein [Actinoallomurus bryophytorum]TQL96972.1 hypothetical protein FB559_2527 [Actinoallomurus bryophytorum]
MANAKIVPLRPRAARPVPARPDQDGPVSVEWDEGRETYVAVCERCTETLITERFDQAYGWADEHRCDPELVALLAEVLDRRAA